MTSLLLITILAACEKPQTEEESFSNPPADGFNLEGSDPKAITLADSVMMAMGGRQAWDDLHYVSWNFFGSRDLLWDKTSGDVRIDFPSRNTTWLINVHDETGQVFVGDSAVVQPDSLKTMISMGKSIWINDSYWLFMPFKLKDSGVTLSYVGSDTIAGGDQAEVLEMTFREVGVTPDNKYRVYIDPNDYFVRQWAYYRSSAQDTASAIWPWDNYKQYGDLMLSADRSDNRGPGNVHVYDSIPSEVFTNPDFDISSLTH